MSSLEWFAFGFLSCSFIKMVTCVSPEKAKENLHKWVDVFFKGRGAP